MNFKKLIAAVSTAAMLGSLTAALPASAATVEETKTASVSVVANVRANSNTWETANNGLNSNNPLNPYIIEDTEADIETTASSNFAAYYYFDRIDIPSNATITSATLTIKEGSQPFSGKPFGVVAAVVPATNDGDSIWTATSTAMRAVLAENSTATVATIDNATIEGGRYLTGDIKTVFNKDAANALVVYNKQRNDSNRRITRNATLNVTYTYDKPVATAVVDGTTTSYESLTDAVSAADVNSTVTLYQDVNLETTRLNITKEITLTSAAGNTYTISGSANPAVILTSANLTVDNVNITTTRTESSDHSAKFGAIAVNSSKSLTLKNLTVTGGVYQENGQCSIALEKVTVTGGVKTRKGVDTSAANTSCSATITDSTVEELYYNSSVDTYTADNSSTISRVTDSNVHFSAEIDTDSVVSENGTGEYANDTAVGFLATITGNGTVSKIDVAVGETSRGAQSLPAGTEITLANGSSALIGIIVSGISTVESVVVTVE